MPLSIGGRGTTVYVVRAKSAQGPDDRSARFRAALGKALAVAGPEMRFELTPSSRPVHSPLRDGGEGLRDFRIAAALGPITAEPRDLLAIEAAGEAETTILKIRPARGTSTFVGPMAPPLEGLTALSDPMTDLERCMLALMFAGHALAGAVMLDPEAPLDAASTGFLSRLAETAHFVATPEHTDAATLLERSVLVAWATAWIGLASRSIERLEAARGALDRLAATGRASLTPREGAQLDANLAIVGLALGGTTDGSRRLADGLAAAKAARAAIAPEIEPAAAMDLDGLIGEIGYRLGIRRGDQGLLNEARSRLERLLRDRRRSSSRGHWQDLLNRIDAGA